jgi:uncharacterized membrane protein
VEGTLDELRAQAEAGSSTLEDIFVRLVGADRAKTESPDWL